MITQTIRANHSFLFNLFSVFSLSGFLFSIGGFFLCWRILYPAVGSRFRIRSSTCWSFSGSSCSSSVRMAHIFVYRSHKWTGQPPESARIIVKYSRNSRSNSGVIAVPAGCGGLDGDGDGHFVFRRNLWLWAARWDGCRNRRDSAIVDFSGKASSKPPLQFEYEESRSSGLRLSITRPS